MSRRKVYPAAFRLKMVYYRQWEEECVKLTNFSKKQAELGPFKHTDIEIKPTLYF